MAVAGGEHAQGRTEWLVAGGFALLAGLVYFFSHPAARTPYDQTFLIAGQFLDLQLGIDHPRPWLELVPGEKLHYSVFPLGAVLTMLPAAVAARIGWIGEIPVSAVAAFIGAAIAYFAYRLSAGRGIVRTQRLLLAAFPVFGSWVWANVENGGAWQLALGFAVVGEMGALYYSLVDRRPLLAGAFFALAFGNRTELILLTPLFLGLLFAEPQSRRDARTGMARLAAFCTVPFALGVATLAYNAMRFHSPFDFGYERIPFLLDDPFYAEGFFSWRGVEPNLRAMLLLPWASQDSFPWIRPTGGGESIFLVSPILLLCLRPRSRNARHSLFAVLAIVALTAVLWLHGNAGGYQFSYRYGMILIPFFFWILLESSPPRPRLPDLVLLALSVLLNGYAVYAFYWAKSV